MGVACPLPTFSGSIGPWYILVEEFFFEGVLIFNVLMRFIV